MQEHPENEALQRLGCQLLLMASSSHDTRKLSRRDHFNRKAALRCGGAERCLDALRAHPDSERVQALACAALSQLVHGRAAVSRSVVQAGGLAVLTFALERHQASASVQLHALAATNGLLCMQRDRSRAKLISEELRR